MVGQITKAGGTNARTGGTFCPTSYTVKIWPGEKEIRRGREGSGTPIVPLAQGPALRLGSGLGSATY